MNAHGGQNWAGFVVVLGVLVFCLVIWRRHLKVEAGADDLLDWLRSLAPDVEHDHVACANPDCGETICACRQPHECTGCMTMGCEHEGFCWDCRLRCRECAVEEYSERARGLERDR